MRSSSIVALCTLGVACLAACGGGSDGGPATGDNGGALADVSAIVFVQRTPVTGTGNVFDYTMYNPGGRLVKLSPPGPNGKLQVLTSGPLFENADVMAWDLSFDAQTIAFSARLQGADHYHLFLIGVDGSNPRQITEGPYDYVYPVFIPGQRLMFTTSKVVEEGAPQFRDEYERQTTSQVGIINLDGGGEVLGPRNVSHRVAPALLPDGRIVYTEWRHMGMVNDGHLRMMNSDMTGQRELFGGEIKDLANSYLKARPIETVVGPDGSVIQRLIAVATSRDRTLQAGKLALIDFAGTEARSTYKDITPLVPAGNGVSAMGVGRYYDAEPVGAPADQRFLVSWADGPVQSEFLETAKTPPNFGLYVLEAKTGVRRPVYDDQKRWDVLARPIKARSEPVVTQSPVAASGSFVVGALNVCNSSVLKFDCAAAVKVRLIEGFSGEEGFNTFGTTEFDGQSRYGEVAINSDHSFAARVPANVPLHMQVVDKYGLSIANESVWISGRPGEQRVCGGCHEDRSTTTLITPGITEAVANGAVNLDTPRPDRRSYNVDKQSYDYSYERIRGVPWEGPLQAIFDAKCVSCHEGTPGPANPQYTVVDKTLGTMQTFVFDLRKDKVSIMVGERRENNYSASYLSLAGLGEMLGEDSIEYIKDPGVKLKYLEPASAKDSDVIQKLNPMQRFPAVDPAVRAFPGTPHPADVGKPELVLTPDEYYQLILNIDMGGTFYARESHAPSDPGVIYKP